MSDPIPFERIRELFLQARELDPSARANYLDRECAADPSARLEVEELLAAADQPHDIVKDRVEVEVDGPAVEHAGVCGTDSMRLPERIADYEVLGLVGRGGMGIVYRAKQARPEREVALKVLRPELVRADLLRRFLQEADVQGTLRHPGIAAVYDAGLFTSEFGDLPYFAMELLDGKPIDVHCDELDLDAVSRARLVVSICGAVQHAHEAGVVHRDLKPGNVLVEMVDGRGVPRVLDFGIARCRTEEQAGTAASTRTGQVFGTLAYMSPEQIDSDLGAIDERTDVYALGILLFELLTGTTPIELDGRPLTDLLRQLRDVEGRPLRELREDLPRDLETVISTATAKDARARYPSARAFAEDLERQLDGHPIQARPPSTWDRVSKFVRRNPGLIAWAAIAFLALSISLLVVSRLAVRNATLAGQEAEGRLALREALYGSDFTQAGRWLIDASATPQLRALVSRWPEPLAGEPELRGWEHRMGRAIVDMRVGSGNAPDVMRDVEWTESGIWMASYHDLYRASVGKQIQSGENLLSAGRRFEIRLGSRGGIAAWRAGDHLCWGRLDDLGSSAFVAEPIGSPPQISPDGHRVAFPDRNHHGLVLVDLETGSRVHSGDETVPVRDQMSFSHDGSLLLTCRRDVPVCELRDSSDGRVLRELDTGHPLRAATLAPDGSRVAWVTFDERLEVFDLETEAVELLTDGIDSRVEVLRWSNDGRQIALAIESGALTAFHVDEGHAVVLRGHEQPVTAVTFSPDGGQLLAADRGRELHLWDLEKSVVRRVQQPERGAGPSAGWLDAKTALLGRTNRPPWPVDVGSGRRAEQPVPPLASRAGFLCRNVDQRLQIVNASGDVVREFSDSTFFGWQPGGDLAAILIGNDLVLWLVGSEALESAFRLRLSRSTLFVAWSPDGAELLVPHRIGGGAKLLSIDALKREVRSERDFRRKVIEAIAWHPTERRFAVGFDAGDVLLFDADRHESARVLEGLHSTVYSLSWHPTEPRLIASSQRGARMWDTERGHAVFALDRWWVDAAFSPDGETLAVVPINNEAAWLLTAGKHEVLPR